MSNTAQELIESFEIDLQVAVATPTSFSNPTTPVREKNRPSYPNTLRWILDPNSSLGSSILPQDMGKETGTSANAAVSTSEKAQDDHSVATIMPNAIDSAPAATPLRLRGTALNVNCRSKCRRWKV